MKLDCILCRKAVEEFIRQLMRETTSNGEEEFNYDAMARYIQNSEFKSLREFFPERVRYGDIMHELFNEKPPDSSPGPSTSSSSTHQHSTPSTSNT
uniref:Saposin B-type domain-containing protein n=1 Tax=Caenorhabditis tropicalis TaxID=1561998 RepID=A0A1I7TVE7_9PELO